MVAGIVTDFKELQYENAQLPRYVTEEGKETLLSFVHHAKAFPYIVVKLDGNEIVLSVGWL